MRAIVPAAGIGTRMRPFTETTPKGLLPIGGRPLLARTLEHLSLAGITEAICVTGHLAEQLREALLGCASRPHLHFVHNPYFSITNSLVSLSLTTPWWDDDFCIIDSDVCFTAHLLDRLLRSRGEALVVDGGRKPGDIDMAVEVREGLIGRLRQRRPAPFTDG